MSSPSSVTAALFGTVPGPPVGIAVLRLVERYTGAAAAIIFFPLNWQLFWLCVAGYFLRIWAMEAVYHRYLSHRAFRACRFVQFVLVVMGAQTGQRGGLWWAMIHRYHHKYVETQRDPHSPFAHSFLYAYSAWITRRRNQATNLDDIPDFAKFPELRWLDKHYIWAFYAGGFCTFLAGHFGLFGSQVGGLAAMLWGVWVPALLTIHAVSLVNTICHMPNFIGGCRRYDTPDRSVNRPFLSLLLLGAGYHNNHHRYAAVARSGFAWYEFDFVYYSLVLLEMMGIISELRRKIPVDVLIEGHITPRRMTKGV